MNVEWNTDKPCNVAGALAAQAAAQPERAALHYPVGMHGGAPDYRSCSYRELDALSDQYARGLLAYGIERGTRVALMVPPGLEFFALFFALFKAGAVPVLIDPGIGLANLRQCLAEAAPEAFIGVPRAQMARVALRWAPHSISRLVTVGRLRFGAGIDTASLRALGTRESGSVLAATRPGELAAILFTSGSTGVPKGVVYRHRHFTAQVAMLREAFDIRPGEIDLPTFPPFALFDPALGMTTVVPAMDPRRPARANPARLIRAIERFQVTNIFGSPALVRVLADHTHRHGLRLPSVRRVISAGAAVPIDVIRRLQVALPAGALVHTPYGATECLPVASASSVELDAAIERRTQTGAGICVGRPVAPNRVGILPISEHAVPLLDESELLPANAAGEVIVHGPTTTDAYWQREAQTREAKTCDHQGRVWHRMGDIGYFDDAGRLWYCGRKSQRVELDGTTLFPDQVEAVFNTHPDIRRTALVGVGSGAERRAVLCAETEGRVGRGRRQEIRAELLRMAADDPRLADIRTVLFHRRFPVDIRHNAKIGRERLAAWAAGRMA
ncbi:MAG: AMP-binding protein [Xanthomonadales bacterium]|nr:AMP-binding protein [Xanthomonadales bacterium]NIN60192.1 AMP-binding protein [Xanthomonadales bacterium]NIN75558.1 AMP-binding protein [Xanthomonadales bacterium]NIO12849.1 AMP-binding protein [Xanthomonadales bacterium]NIP12585.1 AMP-binding protein [Xanthomonadales bacterium]